jgi:hypothetical protein
MMDEEHFPEDVIEESDQKEKFVSEAVPIPDVSDKTTTKQLESGEKTVDGEGAVGDAQTLAALCMSSTETAVSLKSENKIETMEPSKLDKVAKAADAKDDGKNSKKRVRLSREVTRVLEDHFQRDANWDPKLIA